MQPNVERDQFAQDVDAFPELAARNHEMGMEKMPVDPACPADKLIVSTTTIDVTVYVTPAANTTTPCPEDEATTVVTIDSTTTECPEDQMTSAPQPPQTSTLFLNTTKQLTQVVKVSTRPVFVNATQTIPVLVNSTLTSVAVQTPHTETHVFNFTYTTPCPEDETTMTPTPIETEPCPEETEDETSAVPVKTPSMITSRPTSGWNSTATEEPCPDETSQAIKISATPTTSPAPQSTVCIDTSMTPVSSSKFSSTPVKTMAPTTTVCTHDEATGTPKPDSAYCGIHGKPAGTYFIAEFIEDKPGVPVTEEGCYQFCDVSFVLSYRNQTRMLTPQQSVMESTKGCKSFRYYKNQLGAPRRALYGMPVSYSVDDLDKNQPDTWYDLACGSPKEQKWHEADKAMPSNHKQSRWLKWL